MYVYVYDTYMYMYMYIYTYRFIYMYICIHVYIYFDIYSYIYVYVFIFSSIFMVCHHMLSHTHWCTHSRSLSHYLSPLLFACSGFRGIDTHLAAAGRGWAVGMSTPKIEVIGNGYTRMPMSLAWRSRIESFIIIPAISCSTVIPVIPIIPDFLINASCSSHSSQLLPCHPFSRGKLAG